MAMQRYKATSMGFLKPNHKRVEENEIFFFDFDTPAEEGGYSYLAKPDAKEGEEGYGERVVKLPSWVKPAKELRNPDGSPIGSTATFGDEDENRDEGNPKPPQNAVGKQREPVSEHVQNAKQRAKESRELAARQRAAKFGEED